MTHAGAVLRCAGFLLSATLTGCGGGGEAPRAQAPRPPASTFADTLVMTGPGGEEVWFTDGREAQNAAGVICSERVMEIRTPGDTVPVPLLYTGAAPTLEDDSTLEARLWLDCQPGARYHINIHTGRPSLVEG